MPETPTDPLEAVKYPVGRMPRLTQPLNPADRAAHVAILEATPSRLRELADGLGDRDLDQPYRPGGWTRRQVFHHLPESHLNAYLRMKLAATEDAPRVKTYDEQRWAEQPDAKYGPVEMSLALLEALHVRWVTFLRSLPDAAWQRTFLHPEWGTVTIEESLTMYSWHCRHHTAHIEQGLRRIRG